MAILKKIFTVYFLHTHTLRLQFNCVRNFYHLVNYALFLVCAIADADGQPLGNLTCVRVAKTQARC